MNSADIAIAVVITISVLIGLVRGFVVEVLSLVVWAAAVVLAMSFGETVAAWLEGTVSLPSARYALGYLSVFFGVLLVGALLVYVMRKVVQGTGLSGTDRLLGMLFGLARGAIVVVVLVLILGLTPLVRDAWWQESRALPAFRALARGMVQWLPESLAQYFETGALGGRVEAAVYGAISREATGAVLGTEAGRAADRDAAADLERDQAARGVAERKPAPRPAPGPETRKPVPVAAPERKPD